MTRKKEESNRMVTIEITKELAHELESIRESMDKWTTLKTSMDTVIKTVIQYYYISIGFPISQWGRTIKSDEEEMKEMIKIAKGKMNNTDRLHLSTFRDKFKQNSKKIRRTETRLRNLQQKNMDIEIAINQIKSKYESKENAKRSD